MGVEQHTKVADFCCTHKACSVYSPPKIQLQRHLLSDVNPNEWWTEMSEPHRQTRMKKEENASKFEMALYIYL